MTDDQIIEELYSITARLISLSQQASDQSLKLMIGCMTEYKAMLGTLLGLRHNFNPEALNTLESDSTKVQTARLTIIVNMIKELENHGLYSKIQEGLQNHTSSVISKAIDCIAEMISETPTPDERKA